MLLSITIPTCQINTIIETELDWYQLNLNYKFDAYRLHTEVGIISELYLFELTF